MSHSSLRRQGGDHPIAVVTGGASGIGRASAEKLLLRGFSVVIVDIDGERAEQSAADLSGLGSVMAVRADMSKARDVEAMVERVRSDVGRLDAFVNNAGLQRSGSVTEFDEADWDLLLNVNPKSCFLAAKYATPMLAEQGGGVVVNIASIAGLRGGPHQSAYAASKGAIIAFTRSLAVELAPLNIRANCLAPGWVDTPFNAPAIDSMGGSRVFESMIETTVPMKRQGSATEIAQAVAFLASTDSTYMTGQTLVVDGGQI